MARWIGVDLDGTLAKSVNSTGTAIGDPVLPMLERVELWLSRGREVRIFTARASDPRQVDSIRAWLKRHGIEKCGITDRKDLEMIEFYDDKARRVVQDTGRLCSGCRPSRRSSERKSREHAADELLQTDC